MSGNACFQIALYLVVLTALAKPLGAYMARVYEGRPCGLDRLLGGRSSAASTGCAASGPSEEMSWKTLRRRRCSSSTSLGFVVVYLPAALAGLAAARTRSDLPRGDRPTPPSTPR